MEKMGKGRAMSWGGGVKSQKFSWISILPVLVQPEDFVCADSLPSLGRAHSELSGVRVEDVVTLVENVAADGQEQVERQGLQSLTSHRSFTPSSRTTQICLGDIE